MTNAEKTILIKMLAMIYSLADQLIDARAIKYDCDKLAKELEEMK